MCGPHRPATQTSLSNLLGRLRPLATNSLSTFSPIKIFFTFFPPICLKVRMTPLPSCAHLPLSGYYSVPYSFGIFSPLSSQESLKSILYLLIFPCIFLFSAAVTTSDHTPVHGRPTESQALCFLTHILQMKRWLTVVKRLAHAARMISGGGPRWRSDPGSPT